MIPHLAGLLSAHYLPRGRQLEGVGRDLGFQIDESAGAQPGSLVEAFAHLAEVVAAEGRIEKYDVEGRGFAVQPAARIRMHDLDLLGAELSCLSSHTVHGVIVSFHHHDLCGAARCRLEAERAASGVQVEAAGIFDGAGEPIEQRFSDTVGGGSQAFDIRYPQNAAAPLPGYDAYFSRHSAKLPNAQRCSNVIG